jgi:DNA excision repair protein ERCC-2
MDTLAGHLSELMTKVPRSTIVFYPSYSLMERIAGKTTEATRDRSVFFETRSMDQADLMRTVRDFKLSTGNAVLHAVSGGRISEGMDFPGSEMEIAVIAGIPYPKPTAKQRALQHFCDIRFGDGWEHAVKAPTSRKLQQAIGRLIRSETDRGVAIILDRRAVQFKDTVDARRSTDLVGDVTRFFEREQAPRPDQGTEARIGR